MSRKPRTSARRLLACVALAVAGALGVAGTASADPFGLDTPTHNEPGVGSIPDSTIHTFCFSGAGWTAAWQAIVNSRMLNLDVQTVYEGATVACDAATDVTFELNSTMGARGDSRCVTWNAVGFCDAAIVRLNSNAAVLPNDHQRRKTACHEIGHTVGLAHGDDTATFWNDCMLSGTVAAGNQWEQYNAHHVAHINSRQAAAS
ncbi:MAG TPA: hypothetical protein VMU51_35155 [Mycobacteriales bacterium]|nr:hypothetical protein [Mycobacteriales bacterium]